MLCVLFGDFSWCYILFGAIASLLPDLDALPELIRKRKVAAHADNPRDHREGLHYPLLFLTVGFALVSLVGLLPAIIFGVNTFAHFLHDSVGTGWGVKWLYPFSRRNYKFFCEKDNRASSRLLVFWTPSELDEAIRKYGDKDWLQKYLKSPWFTIECVVFAVSLLVLVIIFFVYYQNASEQ